MTAYALRTDDRHASLLGLLTAPLRRRAKYPLLDLRELPDHLKRDLGVLDGHDVPGRIR